MLTTSGIGWSLEPEEVLVIANKNAFDSVSLAKYYIKKRRLPKNNLIKLRVSIKESCTRDEYNNKIVIPVRDFIEKNDSQRLIRCLVLMYGMPLKVAPPALNEEEKAALAELVQKRNDLNNQLKNINEKEKTQSIKKELENLKKKITGLTKANQNSSLDSEIALVLRKDYPLSGWYPNPFFIGYRQKNIGNMPDDVLMVSRLDGPTKKIVKRIIDHSIAVEENGLSGTAYFDARWPEPSEKKTSGAGFYDQSIHRAANRVKKSKKMPVIIDAKAQLFQPGECPEAALYCGWYKLAHYVDAFKWQPGAVGYHIASSECATLKRSSSRVWCKVMLEKGVAATIGPVGEPYVQAFAVPEIFFGLLIDGKLTLAECYLLSNPFWSWKMALVGDPLYRPFKIKNN